MRSKIIHAYNKFINGQYAALKRYLELRRFIRIDTGTFIEAGANDGITQSNTYGFEKLQGWSGLLVEPLPSRAAQCARSRPRSTVLNSALVPYDYKGHTTDIIDCDLMSFVKGSLGEHVDESIHAAKVAQSLQIKTSEMKVPAVTLDAAIQNSGIGKIDFVSLDVEGYELSVLQGFDLEKYHPAYLLIEHGSRPEILRALKGYKPLHQFENNDIIFKPL